MSPTLNLGQAPHPRLAPPRLNLRRNVSFEKAPLSATSSRFNFNHLAFASPPPSPSLPRLVPRPRKRLQPPRPRRLLRILLWVSGFVLFLYLGRHLGQHLSTLPLWPFTSQSEFTATSPNNLPKVPAPIIFADQRGQAKWTVSIPPSADFPLLGSQYVKLCNRCRQISDKVAEVHHMSTSQKRSSHDEQHYVDVHTAEDAGYLPGSVTIGALRKQQEQGRLVGEADNSASLPLCKSSMTFSLASSDAGIGRTMMLLWTAYGVARREGRAFFIDDSRWAYGRYLDMFAAPEVQDCRPPLRHAIVPCPRQANHLIVTPETAGLILPETVDEHGVQAGKNSKKVTSAKRALFDLAHEGYTALFRLAGDDAKTLAKRKRELQVRIQPTAGSRGGRGSIVGLHVRKGDRRPLEFQYHESYIPLDVLVDATKRLIKSTATSGQRSSSKAEAEAQRQRSIGIVASDDPTVYDAAEFSGWAIPAQDALRLASRAAIRAAGGSRKGERDANQNGAFHKFVDEGFGWDGGFWKSMFNNMGSPGVTKRAEGAAPTMETTQLRSLMGRAYLLDLAVLAGASDAVVCTVSSMGCRMLAVMMGWEAAIEKGKWVNVDGDFGWAGAVQMA